MKIDHESKLFFWTGQQRPTVQRAEGVYLWDTDGNRYLDASSGPMISNLGHSNPRVLQAMKEQMDKVTFAYRLYFQCEVAERLADKAIEMLPPGLDRLFLVSGGSEAVESSLKLARQYVVTIGEAQRWKVISMTPSFHGTYPRGAIRDRHADVHRAVCTDDSQHAEDPGADCLSRS